MGVDHDPAMIDCAKKRYINKCSTDKLNFITADAYHLPFDDATVDGVMATSLTGCLSFPDKFFREIYRVLRQGGFAVMTFTNRQSLLLKINSYFRNIMPSTGELKDHNFSFHLYEQQQVKKDLEKIGFAVVQVYYYNFFLNWGDRLLPPRSWAVRLESQKNFKIQRRLGRNFIIKAQKM